jgi:heme/copper-type cytochrome/quinol oxidase subunit 3
MAERAVTGNNAAFDEAAYVQESIVGSFWSGSRLFISGLVFLYAGFAFAYFYLRSVNSNGLWRPHNEQPSFLLGTLVLVLVLAGTGLYHLGMRRARVGGLADWFVALPISLLFVLGAALLQIWTLTRLHFYPGSSGYASVFVGWAPVHAAVLLGGAYWVETLLARTIRDRTLFPSVAAAGGKAETLALSAQFAANAEACGFMLGFLSLVTLFFWILFWQI